MNCFDKPKYVRNESDKNHYKAPKNWISHQVPRAFDQPSMPLRISIAIWTMDHGLLTRWQLEQNDMMVFTLYVHKEGYKNMKWSSPHRDNPQSYAANGIPSDARMLCVHCPGRQPYLSGKDSSITLWGSRRYNLEEIIYLLSWNRRRERKELLWPVRSYTDIARTTSVILSFYDDWLIPQSS
jgi:hypothetical protein